MFFYRGDVAVHIQLLQTAKTVTIFEEFERALLRPDATCSCHDFIINYKIPIPVYVISMRVRGAAPLIARREGATSDLRVEELSCRALDAARRDSKITNYTIMYTIIHSRDL